MTAREALEKTFEDLKVHEEEKGKIYGEDGWRRRRTTYWQDSIVRRAETINRISFHQVSPDEKEEILKLILESCFLYIQLGE